MIVIKMVLHVEPKKCNAWRYVMIHIMKISDNAFERMKKGIKKREYRVNDEKRRLVRVGDII